MTDPRITWAFTFGWACSAAVAGLMNHFGWFPDNPEWWYAPSPLLIPVVVGAIYYKETQRANDEQ